MTRCVNTVPDKVLEKTRYSKLGAAIKAPSVEEPQPKAKQETDLGTNRDYKYEWKNAILRLVIFNNTSISLS